ncbi:MAG: Gfo/Idh/MocA family oxidoreductase [Desulfobacterales bacterium]|jgi:predicted dehydrogenase
MTPYDTIGFGILGAGMAAELHARAITACADQGARIAGFASRSAEHQLAREYDRPVMPLEEMLKRPEVDVVSICSPSGLHADQAMRAMQCGKHVLVEKPMALSVSQAHRMIAAGEAAGCHLGVALQRRAEPLFQRVHQAISAGELGHLVCGLVSVPYMRTMAYYESAAWRGTWELDGGGVLMNQGIHLLDLLLWWMGDPVQIKAQAATRRHAIAVEDTLVASLRFANGAMATVTATTAVEPGFAHRIEVYGTRGGIQIEGEAILRWQTAADDEGPVALDRASGAGAGGDPRGIPLTGHVGLIKNFMAALRGEEALCVDGRQGVRSVAAVEAIYAAAGLDRQR